jgi:hypothetical protein
MGHEMAADSLRRCCSAERPGVSVTPYVFGTGQNARWNIVDRQVVVSDETWVETQRIAGRTVRTPQNAHWSRIATPELAPYPPEAIWRAGHQRWGIENHAFNELTQHYHLEHCPHHHPVATLAWLLILLLGFNLFEVFVRLHGKLWRSGHATLQEMARNLDHALVHPRELVPLWSG